MVESKIEKQKNKGIIIQKAKEVGKSDTWIANWLGASKAYNNCLEGKQPEPPVVARPGLHCTSNQIGSFTYTDCY